MATETARLGLTLMLLGPVISAAGFYLLAEAIWEQIGKLKYNDQPES